MAHSAQDICSSFGRVAAYAAYNAGGSVLVGLVRTTVSVAYMAKHWFYHKQYQQATRTQQTQAREAAWKRHTETNQKVYEADQDAAAADTGWKRITALFRQGVTRVEREVGNTVESIYEVAEEVTEAVMPDLGQLEKERMKEWRGEALRGVLEIFWFGAPYFTYADNFKDRRSISVLGVKELADKIHSEREFDQSIRLFVPRYNPAF